MPGFEMLSHLKNNHLALYVGNALVPDNKHSQLQLALSCISCKCSSQKKLILAVVTTLQLLLLVLIKGKLTITTVEITFWDFIGIILISASRICPDIVYLSFNGTALVT